MVQHGGLRQSCQGEALLPKCQSAKCLDRRMVLAPSCRGPEAGVQRRYRRAAVPQFRLESRYLMLNLELRGNRPRKKHRSLIE